METPEQLRKSLAFYASERLPLPPRVMAEASRLRPAFLALTGGGVRTFLEGLLVGTAPEVTLGWLEKSGLLDAVLPEVSALVGVEQPPEFHPEGDVWIHTLKMFRHFVWRDALTAWSILLHDVGKPPTQSRDPDGRIRFFGHEELGASLAGTILERLEFEPAEREAIVHAVRNHMRFASVREMKKNKLRSLLDGEFFPVELELHRLDCIASHGKMECFDFLLSEAIKRENEIPVPPPWVRGRDLLKAGFAPGADFGPLLDEMFRKQCGGGFDSPEMALAAAVAKLKQMRKK